MTEPRVDQLVFVTVAGSQADELTRTLVRDGFHVTQIHSRGGFVQESTVSLLIGLESVRLPRLLKRVRTYCPTTTRYVPAHLEMALAEVQPLVLEAQVGGATVYVLEIERFVQV